ncbi:alkaline phosphatase family protein [Belliella kenyensis]|uniref:Alkaline phosphatase family protein n=1 Tax=Belliella kenyensis TaxID=1472724 RepID=A0ABV8EJA3_9BACT|nr:ectonucleotide pyrophosphatase/phosphodiesterase [Belliella kenyensis]MCH7402448.1 ectonucleotide pyrophosphatase/phosphodiesterase [Belliella kenyensis]MDN3603639.1 ectonucleotide pyrophosphatase/phosphodiesterase [Belliella kenyensis]
MSIIKGLIVVSCIFGMLQQSLAQSGDSYVILISLDGYRYDYTARFQPKNLLGMIAEGTAAKSMIPSFPTKTFPNHYSIATGMKPENHGLVNNAFYDSRKDEVYSIRNRNIVEDGYWYGGKPLWVLAEEHGLKAASFFFVGSEADVQGVRPSYYRNYDASVSNLTRVTQALTWLELPEEERPRLITLYFSDIDDVGHAYGPNNDEQLKRRIEKLDHELGVLFEGVKSLDLEVNLFVVSDHGMVDVPKENLINLDHLTKDIDARVVNNGALAHLYLNNPLELEDVFLKLSDSSEPFQVVKVKDKRYYKNITSYADRLGDLLIMPDLGFYLATTPDMVKYQQKSGTLKTEVFGEHGFSPAYKEMHAIFYAAGESIKEGLTIDSFQNIHVYPLIAHLLGLPIPEGIDGDLKVLKKILKSEE